MKIKMKMLLMSLSVICAAVVFGYSPRSVHAEGTSVGWDETGSIYYVKDEGEIVKADGIFKVDSDYLYFQKGVLQSTYTGLKKVEDEYEDTFDLYYIENGKAVVNTWKTLSEKKGNYKYYFGSNGKAYKAGSISDMRTTKVVVKAVDGVKYGFDENGHWVTGVWSTGKKLVYFDSKGVYNDKKSKKYQQAVKSGKKSKKMVKNIKKMFGKPKKIKTTSSCNPFDIKKGKAVTNSVLKNYKGYNYIYKNIIISMTKNKKTGVYYMDGASPIDLN